MSLSFNYGLSQQSAFEVRLTKPFSKGPGACWLSCLTEALLLVYLWSAFNHFMKLGNPHLLNCSGPQRNFMACHQSRSAERKAERCFQIKLQFFSLDWHNLSSAKEGPCVEILEQIQPSDSHCCSLHFALSCTVTKVTVALSGILPAQGPGAICHFIFGNIQMCAISK